MSQTHAHHGINATGHDHDHSDACSREFTVWKNDLIFSGTAFAVIDSSGNLLFRVENSTPNVETQLLLMDATGVPLIMLRRKVVSLHQRWEGFICGTEANEYASSSEKPAFSIKRSSIICGTTSIDVFVGSSSTGYLREQCDYHIKGSFRDRSCAIYDRSHSVVAQVKRKLGSCDLLLEKDVFTLVVYPGFDAALIISWIVVVHHINTQDSLFSKCPKCFKDE